VGAWQLSGNPPLSAMAMDNIHVMQHRSKVIDVWRWGQSHHAFTVAAGRLQRSLVWVWILLATTSPVNMTAACMFALSVPVSFHKSGS
jgi:hypothetical protein